MSKAAKGASANLASPTGLPFEEALQKLESIVEAMEGDDLPLETLLARYEEGTKLAQQCQAKLAEAELKIQQLEQDATGDLRVKPISLPTENSPTERGEL
jgi:exodeoxyribonuclease VII small subunit